MQKIGDSGVKQAIFGVLSVHELLQHLALPGEITKPGK